MKMGLHLGYWNRGPYHAIEIAKEAENLGYDSIWTAEAYGSDCISPLAWLGSHTKKIKLGTSVMQISARTPVAAAMTALTMDHLSEGRFICGIGVSGPQVVEGWYGQGFRKPLERTREWMEIFRQVIAREAPVQFQGNQYQLPFNGQNSMGLGKPLKSITHPLRKHIPVYMGAEGPKNIALSTEIADGWFPIFVSPYRMNIFDESLKNKKDDFEIAAMVQVNVNDDLKAALLPVKMMLGLYLGGMGAKDENFHKNLMERMGFDVQEVQDLYLEGKHMEAIEAVPDALADEISLCGPMDRIKERIQDWKKSDVTTMMIGRSDDAQNDITPIQQFAEMVL
ncbi:MAG: LLM class F420-dependent oxidoreductase [Pseudomonadales bacterium]|nr:LLM class F420-dependent oxidoreductase [Pseudomonadales bacterium]